jgi:ABC-type transport system involved in multi-copper enzyme maturation permease subunit
VAESFFAVFVSLQFLAVFLLTPAFTAGAIADEREQRTLEELLTTDLSGREIVLGKLGARLANLMLLVLAGLPILSLLPLLGGVDPDLVVVSFVAVLLSLASVGAVGVLNSVYCRRSRDAVFATYLEVIGYLVVSWCFWAVGRRMGGSMGSWFCAGNVLIVGDTISRGAAGGDLTRILPPLLYRYAVFHASLALACSAWAAVRLRAICRQENEEGPERTCLSRLAPSAASSPAPVLDAVLTLRPPVGERPVLWKELHAEPGLLRGGVVHRLLTILCIICLALAAGTFFLGLLLVGSNDDQKQFINLWVRVLGTGLAGLMLLCVALRAAGRISREREGQTLDSLLATALSRQTILHDKWLGSILSVVHGFWALGAIWALGLLTGGLDFLAGPPLVTAWLVFSDFATNLGLWFSLVSRTTRRAVTWTLLTLAAINVAPWLVAACCRSEWISLTRPTEWFRYGEVRLSPPVVLWSLAYYYGDFQVSWRTPDPWEQLPSIFVILACYFMVARLLGRTTAARFGQLAEGPER